MYADPSLIRDHVLKIRLNDEEQALVDAVCNYTGQEKAPFLRQLMLEQARLVLAGQADFAPSGPQNEVPQSSRNGTF